MNTIKRYTRPENFADSGDVKRTDYYVAYGQHRDSDTLTRSNFRSILRQLGGESDTVLVLRDSHWAVGWVEAIYIHESDTAHLEIADDLITKLQDYPVVDESDWSELEYNEASTYWEHLPIRDRVDICRQFHISIFAARRNELPEDPRGGLIEYLAE